MAPGPPQVAPSGTDESGGSNAAAQQSQRASLTELAAGASGAGITYSRGSSSGSAGVRGRVSGTAPVRKPSILGSTVSALLGNSGHRSKSTSQTGLTAPPLPPTLASPALLASGAQSNRLSLNGAAAPSVPHPGNASADLPPGTTASSLGSSASLGSATAAGAPAWGGGGVAVRQQVTLAASNILNGLSSALASGAYGAAHLVASVPMTLVEAGASVLGATGVTAANAHAGTGAPVVGGHYSGSLVLTTVAQPTDAAYLAAWTPLSRNLAVVVDIQAHTLGGVSPRAILPPDASLEDVGQLAATCCRENMAAFYQDTANLILASMRALAEYLSAAFSRSTEFACYPELTGAWVHFYSNVVPLVEAILLPARAVTLQMLGPGALPLASVRHPLHVRRLCYRAFRDLVLVPLAPVLASLVDPISESPQHAGRITQMLLVLLAFSGQDEAHGKLEHLVQLYSRSQLAPSVQAMSVPVSTPTAAAAL